MSLIVTVATLLYWNAQHPHGFFYERQWIRPYISWGVQQKSMHSWGAFFHGFALLLIALVALSWVYRFLEPLFFGFVGGLLEFVVFATLIAHFARKSFLSRYLELLSQNQLIAATELAHEKISIEVTENAQFLHSQVWQKWLALWNNYVFAPMLLYWLGGPIFLLAYLLIDEMLVNEHSSEPLKEMAFQVLDTVQFLSSRVLAMTFALAGNFFQVIDDGVRGLIDWQKSADQLLSESAKEALGVQPLFDQQAELIPQMQRQMMALERLLHRSMMVWLGVLALSILLF